MIVLYNVMSETLKKSPIEAVVAWLVRHDAELALPTATIAEIAYRTQKIRPDQRAGRRDCCDRTRTRRPLAPRNLAGFETTCFELISPRDY